MKLAVFCQPGRWPVLFKQFQLYGLDTALYSKMYNNLLKRFSSKQFLLDLTIMYDILAELAILSENLQKRNASIVYADKLINESLKEKPGTQILEAQIAIKNGQFCSIPLTDNTKMTSINQQQLLSSVAIN
ncbi:hypothetical protein PR048_008417 [Dryococelus australis]|uniref:Uncharacterized protein n=1 Tax=Dryococelus australis TaxID=614101 RepID=A0ABQ9HYR5_9NEOP|nr:hypothetical protein PR048_008417 [Dryococelus australis]